MCSSFTCFFPARLTVVGPGRSPPHYAVLRRTWRCTLFGSCAPTRRQNWFTKSGEAEAHGRWQAPATRVRQIRQWLCPRRESTPAAGGARPPRHLGWTRASPVLPATRRRLAKPERPLVGVPDGGPSVHGVRVPGRSRRRSAAAFRRL